MPNLGGWQRIDLDELNTVNFALAVTPISARTSVLGFGRSRRRGEDPAYSYNVLRKGKNSVIEVLMAGIAHTLERRSLDLVLPTLGSRGPEIATFRSRLALRCSQNGRITEVEPLFVDILQRRKKMLGPKHPDTLTAMVDHLVTFTLSSNRRIRERSIQLLQHQDLGRYEDAEAAELEVYELRRERLGPKHPDTLAIMGSLAATKDVYMRLKACRTMFWN